MKRRRRLRLRRLRRLLDMPSSWPKADEEVLVVALAVNRDFLENGEDAVGVIAAHFHDVAQRSVIHRNAVKGVLPCT